MAASEHSNPHREAFSDKLLLSPKAVFSGNNPPSLQEVFSDSLPSNLRAVSLAKVKPSQRKAYLDNLRNSSSLLKGFSDNRPSLCSNNPPRDSLDNSHSRNSQEADYLVSKHNNLSNQLADFLASNPKGVFLAPTNQQRHLHRAVCSAARLLLQEVFSDSLRSNRKEVSSALNHSNRPAACSANQLSPRAVFLVRNRHKEVCSVRSPHPRPDCLEHPSRSNPVCLTT